MNENKRAGKKKYETKDKIFLNELMIMFSDSRTNTREEQRRVAGFRDFTLKA